MRKPKKEIQLTSYDELLGINEAEQNSFNQVFEVPLNELYPFKNHPFHVNDDEKMAETVESIKNYGILNPALVRPRAEGGYELIAGHRRKRGCELAGKSKMPVLIRNYTDDEAVIVMVDSNIQRENLLPSEKAYAYKMKMDAVKHQGIKDENAVSVDSADLVGQAAGDSGRTVQRYIRLTCLIPELLKLLDEGKINFTVGVSLTYLSETEQIWVKDCIVSGASSVTGSMATKLKQYSGEGKLTELAVQLILNEKKTETGKVTLTEKKIRKYFPTIALSVKTARVTADVLKNMLRKYLSGQKQKGKNSYKVGKQSYKELKSQGSGLSNIEITDGNIKSFERVAKKYRLDFALKKDSSTKPPTYYVFFKGQDTEMMNLAFKKYLGVQMNKKDKPSIMKKLMHFKDAVSKGKNRERAREQQKDRGQSL